MKTIGLTGGIGSGKTTVARGLQKFGAVVIDADAKGHLVLEMPDVKSKLGQIFGQGIFVKSDIDRKTLSKLAFESKENVQHLNRIVHPKILTLIAEDLQTLARQDFNYIVIDAALLFEVKLDKLCDCTVTVDAPIDQCIERVKKRNHLTETQIRQRMRFQLSFQEKRARADYVLVNDAALEILHEKIKKLNDWILHFC